MNEYQKQSIRNTHYRFVDSSKCLGNESRHPMCRYNVNNTRQHEVGKFLKAMECREIGHWNMTEVYLIDDWGRPCGRADNLDLDVGILTEITVSEKEKDHILKQMKYPSVFELEFERAEDVIKRNKI